MNRKSLIAASVLGVCLWIVAGVVGYDLGRRTAEAYNKAEHVTSGEMGRQALEENQRRTATEQRRP